MHKITKNNVSLGITLTSLLISVITYGGAKGQSKLASPEVVAQESVTVTTTLEPTVKPAPTDIKGYIEYKFGNFAPRALEVLECENKTLNPYALNDNTLWGGIGVDRGYWQINNVYHPYVSDWCASDVVCSTDYAFRMFVNDNYTFVRWTCGR